MRLAILGAAMLLCTPALAATDPPCVSPDLALARAKAFAEASGLGAMAAYDAKAGTLTIILQGVSVPLVVHFKDGCLIPEDEQTASKYGPPEVRI